jgi:hypothetical protein
MDIACVLCKVRTDILFIIYMSVGLKIITRNVIMNYMSSPMSVLLIY